MNTQLLYKGFIADQTLAVPISRIYIKPFVPSQLFSWCFLKEHCASAGLTFNSKSSDFVF